jgi:hypothetical protein
VNAANDLSAPRAAPWYRPGIADLIFLLVGLAALRGAQHSMLDDPGLGWHLRNLDAMLEQGGWLRIDPFTEPRDGERAWYTNQWLGEAPLWLGWRWAGLEGIAVANALIIGLMARLLYRMLIADGLAWPLAFLWTVLGAVGTSCSWNARPNVLSILFLLLTARACVLFHEGRLSRAGTLWLLPLFAAWANAHGGFVGGLLTLGLATCAEGAQALLDPTAEARPAAWRRMFHLAVLTAGAFAATLVNPYGFSLYHWVFQLLGNPYFMELHQEWLPPDFHSAGAMRYELLILLFPLVVGLSARRPSLVEIVLAVAWLHFALTGFRYVALWVVVAVPLLARSSVAIPHLVDLARRLKLTATGDSLFATTRAPAPWAWSAAVALALFGAARGIEGRFAFHSQGILATDALDHLLDVHAEWRAEHGARPVVFHDYNWGGYLTWHGWPEVLNWIDDRNEVQGQERIEQYFSLLRADPGWDKTLDGARVELVCIALDVPLAGELAARPRVWHESYRDEWAVVFERVRPLTGAAGR